MYYHDLCSSHHAHCTAQCGRSALDDAVISSFRTSNIRVDPGVFQGIDTREARTTAPDDVPSRSKSQGLQRCALAIITDSTWGS